MEPVKDVADGIRSQRTPWLKFRTAMPEARAAHPIKLPVRAFDGRPGASR